LYDSDQTGSPAAYPDGTKLVGYNITWDGVPGYDYYAYYEVMDARGEIQRATTQVKGQTVFAFGKADVDTAPALKVPFIKRSLAAGKENWSILACKAVAGPDADGAYTAASNTYGTAGTGGYSGDVVLSADDHGAGKAADLWGALVDVFDSGATPAGSVAAKFRIAVVPANPGGFPIEEQRTVRYSAWMSVAYDNASTPVAMFGVK
jgi:hypothetical protein